jgi:L-amino acid N-acyltransferase YncA
MANSTLEHYPKQIKLRDGKAVEVRLMTSTDRDAILRFARKLSEEDLLFLRTDITDPAIVDAWIENVRKGTTITLLAELNGEMIGYASLHQDHARWTRRVGEIRVNLASPHRGVGLGRALTSEIFEVGKSQEIKKMVVMMTPEQSGARKVCERLGFQVEALLADWVEDRHGHPRDLLVMGFDLTGFTDQATATA